MPTSADEIFDEQQEKESLAKLLLPFLYAAFQKGIRQGMAQGSQPLKFEDIFTDAVKLAIKQKALYHAALSTGATKAELQVLIHTAITKGQSVSQLAKAIKDQFAIDSKVRPLRIARTELTDAINDGTTQTLRKEGHRGKEWSTVRDGRERETHAAADGQVIGIDDVFNVGGHTCRYPGDDNLPPHERIFCRCTVVAAGLTEDRIRRINDSFIRSHGQLEKSLVLHLRRDFERQRNRVLAHFPSLG